MTLGTRRGVVARQIFSAPSPAGGHTRRSVGFGRLVTGAWPRRSCEVSVRSLRSRSDAVNVSLQQVNSYCRRVNNCELAASNATVHHTVIYSLWQRLDVGVIKGGNSMSFVTTQPEALAAAAGNLQGIGTTMSAQNAAAAAPTTGVVPAAADEVSALTAAQFAAHAQMYQAVSAQAAAIHEMFVNTLTTSSGSYAATEAANAAAAG